MNRSKMSDEDKSIYKKLYTKCDCGDSYECMTCRDYNQQSEYLREKYKS